LANWLKDSNVSRRIRWAWSVASIKDVRYAYEIFVIDVTGIDYLGPLDADGRMVFGWILKE
jgi:hypothetical protein